MTLFWRLLALLSWQIATVPTSASLRGISATHDGAVWASGTGGTVIHSSDGGAHWDLHVIDRDLDVRAIHAFDRLRAVAMSSGTGNLSRVFRTDDGGAHWTETFRNPDAEGFFDALQFWDEQRGLIVGDPVDGGFAVFRTDDGGVSWRRLPGPVSEPGESLFAASNSALVLGAKHEAWFGTGGGRIARVAHSTDGGHTWTMAETPIVGSATAGIFSLARCRGRMIAAGGNYQQPDSPSSTMAISNGGREWRAPNASPNGYRSAVIFARSCRHAVAVGTAGADESSDGGQTWKHLQAAPAGINAAAVNGPLLWVVGASGHVATLQMEKH